MVKILALPGITTPTYLPEREHGIEAAPVYMPGQDGFAIIS
jgi:hypothetical protein